MTRGNTAMIVVALCVVAAGGISVSCDNSRGRLPKSGGAPYEVLVVGDKDNFGKKGTQHRHGMLTTARAGV